MLAWKVVGTALLAGACAQDRVGQGASNIVGGNPTSEYPAVLLLEAPDGSFCTGSLVAPNVALTAAHCQVVPGWTATVMTVDEPVASSEVVEVVPHRYHDGGSTIVNHDIALARLAGELPAEPLPFVTVAFEQHPLAASVLAVGFGVDDGVALTGAGVKRVGAFSITWATHDYMIGGERGTSICYGDSGGPALMSIDGVSTVVGVASATGETCRQSSAWTRVDSYAGEFVVPFVDAWSGPCRSDGSCATEGCRTPDPDCAPCGIDGACSAGCDQVDLDCPLAGFFADACGSPDDCESRLCVEAICSQVCDDTERFCPSGYLCESRDGAQVCIAEVADGGCSTGGAGGSGAPAAVLLLLLLVSRRACCRAPRRPRRCPGTA